jgi:chloride channel 3/4/5
VREAQRGSTFEKAQAMFDAASGWLCVLMVGLGAGFYIYFKYTYLENSTKLKILNFEGIVAGVVDIGSGWTASLRSGVCPDAFWLNREQCCWDSNATVHDDYKNVMCEKVSSKSYLLNTFY